MRRDILITWVSLKKDFKFIADHLAESPQGKEVLKGSRTKLAVKPFREIAEEGAAFLGRGLSINYRTFREYVEKAARTSQNTDRCRLYQAIADACKRV